MSAPAEVRAYLNREDLDFGVVADMAPVQRWDLQELLLNGSGQLECPTKWASAVRTSLQTLPVLSLHCSCISERICKHRMEALVVSLPMHIICISCLCGFSHPGHRQPHNHCRRTMMGS